MYSKHRDKWKEIATKVEKEKKTQPKINTFMSKSNITKQVIRDKYLRWIVEDELPLSLCESIKFREFMKTVNPNYEPEDRKTLIQRVSLKAADMRFELKEILKGRKISITADCWTSNARESYFVLTCHMIDGNWKVRSMVLACENFPGSHRAEDINRMIVSCLETFEIKVINLHLHLTKFS